MNQLPLQGVRILSVEQYGAGPFGSMYLADLGAEVIKIENPDIGGDISRQTGPYFLGEGDSHFFQTFNRNKKSLALNLKVPHDRKIFEDLVKDADAVMNNLRGDQPAKLGIDYDSLKALNPKIVCAHLSAYGRDNDRADWPGYDYLMQAEAGFMALTGEPDAPPARFGLSMVDFMTGVTTSMGLLAALLGAGRTGIGCDVDVSLFDVALQQLTYPATWFLNEGHITERMPRSAHPSTVPCQLYTTADGWLFVMAMTPKFWIHLIEGLSCSELAQDPRFIDARARRENREELTEILDAIFVQQSTAHWLALFKGRVPMAPVYQLDQALNNPYLQQVGMIQSLPHDQQTDFKVLSNPIKINGDRLPGRGCSALGADNQSLIDELKPA
ncbi:CoA transferase [Aestuariicella hydrocarbonica]|uniref:CoA transferase n=1 Tax=Pseudomaricurvus hydrocarbonicus TaxID=1470433 RepID=A0A9E5T3J7_9GAMM|nr:CoA transferase [Aestuariicella hydrocarbonica]NHO67233.1 CoA transferase [Aestuariicella hydrocarbonica]